MVRSTTPHKLPESRPRLLIVGNGDDPEFAEQWYEAHENAVDVVESVIYQQGIGGNTLAGFFYLKAHHPIYRDRVSIDIEQVKSEIEERVAPLRENPDLLARAIPALTEWEYFDSTLLRFAKCH